MQKYFDGCRKCSPPLQVYLAALISCEMSRGERRNNSLSLWSSRMWRRVVWYRIRKKQSGVHTEDGETRYLEILILPIISHAIVYYMIMNLIFVALVKTVKSKVVDVHTMKEYRRSRSTAPSILNLEAGWSPEPVRTLFPLRNTPSFSASQERKQNLNFCLS
jgi:hypothetical protein